MDWPLKKCRHQYDVTDGGAEHFGGILLISTLSYNCTGDPTKIIIAERRELILVNFQDRFVAILYLVSLLWEIKLQFYPL